MPTPDANKEAPACPGPQPIQRGAARYAMPAGAVDAHAHVIGTPPDHPFVSGRSYTPPPASEADYLAMLDSTGMTYGVLIQVSVHGVDNSLMMKSLRAHPKRLRGIAVVDPGVAELELRALKEAGVVGLRLNVLFGGGIGLDALDRYEAICRELGWHLQFLIDARNLPSFAARLSRLRVPAVIDHMGHFPTSEGLRSPGFQSLLGLVRDGAYVKLQGAFRCSVQGPPYADTIPFARALNDAAPTRSIWGSDWPHVSNWGPQPNTGDLLDLMADWVPDEARRRQLFVENPAGLYGFPATAMGTSETGS
jgi:2-pyrone-4,6-dicarboxylate lactonase